MNFVRRRRKNFSVEPIDARIEESCGSCCGCDDVVGRIGSAGCLTWTCSDAGEVRTMLLEAADEFRATSWKELLCRAYQHDDVVGRIRSVGRLNLHCAGPNDDIGGK